MISIQVPTQGYLRKFLLARAGSADGRIVVSNTNTWGILLWKILSRRPYRIANIKRQYDSQVTFLLSEFFYSRSGFELTDDNIAIFNRYLKSQFEEALFDFLTINLTMPSNDRPTIDSLILTYLEFYNISENERSLDSLVKAYQRWRNARNYRMIRV